MPATAKARPRREVKNTYKLPEGKRLRLALRGWFREQRIAVLAWLETGRIELKAGNEPVGLFDMPEWDAFGMDAAELSDRLFDGAKAIFETAGRSAWDALKRGRDWLTPRIWPTSAQDPIVEKLVRDVAKEINKTTRQKIQDAIGRVRGDVAEGRTDAVDAKGQIADELKRIFDESERKRARRIAETEASRIAHEAQYQAGKESTLVTGWRWLCSEGACDVCLEIEAECEFVPMGRPFAFIGDNIDYMMIMHPPAHPHCRCSIAEVMITDEQPEWGETLIDPAPSQSKLKRAAEEQAGVEFVPPENADPKEYVTVVIDVRKADADMQGRENYVRPGGEGGIEGRYENFRDFLGRARVDGTAIEQPRGYISLEDGRFDLGDGRHRWAVFRDGGQSTLPVTVPRDEADEIRRRYGAKP